MKTQKLISCFLCRKEVEFYQKDNNTFITHLKLEHNINFHLNFLLKMNLMDNKSLAGFFSKFNEIYDVEEDKNEDFAVYIEDVYSVQNASIDYSEDESNKDIQEFESKVLGDFEEDDEEQMFSINPEKSTLKDQDNSKPISETYDHKRQQSTKDDEEQLLIEQECLLEDSLNTTAKIAELDHQMEYGEYEEDLIQRATSMKPENNPDGVINTELQFDELGQEVLFYEEQIAVDFHSSLNTLDKERLISEKTKTNKQKRLSSCSSCTKCSILLIKRVLGRKIRSLM